jgi:hypothetical protein
MRELLLAARFSVMGSIHPACDISGLGERAILYTGVARPGADPGFNKDQKC